MFARTLQRGHVLQCVRQTGFSAHRLCVCSSVMHVSRCLPVVACGLGSSVQRDGGAFVCLG